MAFQKTFRFRAVLVASATLIALTIAAPASASVKYVAQWGSLGMGPGQFGGPLDLAATASGTVFVNDTFNNQIPRVQRFTSRGTFELGWGSAGIGDSQFLAPGGISAGSSGAVYVGDHSQNRIQRFSSDGTFLGQWGTSGSGESQFTAPWGIATDPQDRVYVVDYGNNRIQKFNSSGHFLDQWGSFGSGDGQFLSPTFVTADGRGHMYVADSGNSRIQKFTSSGKYLDQWDSPGPGAGAPDYPLGLAADPKGNVYVVGTNSIQKYDPHGVMLTRWGKFGIGNGQFRNPQGIATDSSGNVYVGDSGNDRVQKFHDSGPPYPDPGTARLKAFSPAKIRVRGGRTVRMIVPVRNTGSNPVKKAKVCIPRSSSSARAIGRVGCVALGSIGVGKRKVAHFRVNVKYVSARTVKLRVQAVASNAGPAKARTAFLITGCRP